MKEIIPIPSCSRDVTMHLKSVKASRSSVVSEGELILLRAGIFDDDGKKMTVCPKHRECLGVYWRPSRVFANTRSIVTVHQEIRQNATEGCQRNYQSR